MTRLMNPTLESGLTASLATSNVFGSLGSNALTAIANICQIYSYQKRDIITKEGQQLGGIYIVKSGQAILQYQSTLRHQYLSTIINPGMCFGLTALIPNEAASATATVLTALRIIYIPKEKLLALYKEYPEIAICITSAFYSYVKRLMKLVLLIQTPSVKGRLATWILEQPTHKSETDAAQEHLITIPVSKVNLAKKLGVRGETLSRTLGEMRDAGCIEICDKVINILKPDILQSYIISDSDAAAGS